MTGFGSGEHAVLPRGKVLVELRALNHRFLEVRVRTSRETADLAAHAEMSARERFARGRIEIVVRAEGVASPPPVLDRERALEAYKQLQALRDEIAPGEPVPAVLLSSVPDLFVVESGSGDSMKSAFDRALEAASRDLDTMRTREGVALERDMREHLAHVCASVADIERRAPDALAAAQKRLRERLDRLVSSTDVTFDPARIEQEIAVLADRGDVAEEIARLRSHAEQLAALFAHAGPVGRRIDFLLQEMTREVNTMGSKSADVAIARAVVDMKAEVERMREQAQNIE